MFLSPFLSNEMMTHEHQAEDAFQTAFKILQYFAVGIQQVLLDIVLYDGKMWPEFNRIENQLYQITCEIKLGMYSKGVRIY